MKIVRLLFIPLLLYYLSGCNSFLSPKEIDLEIPFKLKPVINGFIAPYDSLIYLDLSYNQPINDSKEVITPNLDDVNITLIRDDKMTVDFFHVDDYYGDSLQTYFKMNYQEDFILPGRKYELFIQIANLGDYRAITEVPYEDQPFDIVSHTIEILDNPTLFVRSKNIENPFSLGFYNIDYGNGNEEFRFKSLQILYDERDSSGEQIFEEELSYQPENEFFRFANLEKGYYDYLFELNKRALSGSDPFTRFSLLPTNIEGGLGYFGSVNFRLEVDYDK